tara:strand:- start:904 stop:1425 length:522 start_codon:yes stop_codon:yes gene_type:complete
MSNSPMGYNPFKMKAGKDSGYDNSPMKKNYGQFGVGTSEMPEKPTPNKFMGMGMLGGSIGKMMQKLKDRKAASKAQAAGSADGGGGGDEAAQSMMDQQAGAMEGGQESMDAGGGEVPQHGPEAHSGGKMMKRPGGIFKGLMGGGKAFIKAPGGSPFGNNKKPGDRNFLGGMFG